MAGVRTRRSSWAAAALAGVALAASGCGCGGKGVTCPAGLSDCGGVCTDTQTDPGNCRFCGLRCAAGAGCVAGTCQCLVPGQVACGSPPVCVGLDADPHCGACDRACAPLGSCGGTPPACTCPSPALACPGASPECVDPATNGLHCGGCGHRCGLGTCISGACSCDAGATACPGASPECVDTQADPANCGACAGACPPGQACVCAGGEVCSAGHCCPSGRTWCGTACTDTRTDPANCGACAGTCPAGQVCACVGTDICSAGHCCAQGQTWCGAACANTATDPGNCGTCGHACAAGQVCGQGVCCASSAVVCGSTTPLCCQGTGCCGSACQTGHDNGLGGNFFDCNPLGTPGSGMTYTAAMARAAGAAWNPAPGATVPCITGDAWQVQAGGQCATWSYQGQLAGYVSLGAACTCPLLTDRPWN